MSHHSPLVPSAGATNHTGQSSSLAVDSEKALSRTLGHVELGQRKIVDCFSEYKYPWKVTASMLIFIHRFFQHYALAVPGIFDGDKNPDAVYDTSPFLFWTIVYVGSRKYSRDPTIAGSLTRPLNELARQSLFDPEHALSTIRAAIAFCLWPPPINTTFKDPSHAIMGAAFQLAIQIGLPFAFRKQDFTRVPIERADIDLLFRPRLWMYCQTVVQWLVVYLDPTIRVRTNKV
jgi:hypothetical protein